MRGLSGLIFVSIVLCAGSGYGLSEYVSATAIAGDPSGEHLYVADKTGHQIIRINISSGKVTGRFSLPGAPTGLAIQKNVLWVTTGADSGVILEINKVSGRILRKLEVNVASRAPVLSNDGKRLFSCSQFTNEVIIFDTGSGRELKRVAVKRDPFAAAITPDDRYLVVANRLPVDASTASHVAAEVSVIDAQKGELVRHIKLPDGSTGVQGVCISSEGRFAWVTHLLGRNRVPATQLENGWLITNALSVVDLSTLTLADTFILDDVGRGAANPWGVAVSPDEKYLVVALSGVHEIVRIDLQDLINRIGNMSTPTGIRNAKDSISYQPTGGYDSFNRLNGIKTRIPLNGNGPRSIAIAGSRVYAGMYFSGSVESVALAGTSSVSESIQLNDQPPFSAERLGERLFHDAELCFQNWQSCAGCHPGGRTDGMNWDLTNDGIGNPKNAKSLLFAGRTPPLTMTGIFESLEQCVPFEIQTILFSAPKREEADALVAYIKSLSPVRNPSVIKPELQDSIARGKKMFEKAECMECHDGEYYTTMRIKHIGTSNEMDHQARFDIPTLREVWLTAPYLHDGRARTIHEVLTTFNPEDRHGETSQLSSQDIDDLVNYVLSL
ncbi:MAG: c-type cytochrome [Verrucomicrobia bacterium]|nr:c-type cytochrome [Verrucomicrobiota bacterium]